MDHLADTSVVSQIYLDVTSGPLVAHIKSGKQVAVSPGVEILIDASDSYDSNLGPSLIENHVTSRFSCKHLFVSQVRTICLSIIYLSYCFYPSCPHLFILSSSTFYSFSYVLSRLSITLSLSPKPLYRVVLLGRDMERSRQVSPSIRRCLLEASTR